VSRRHVATCRPMLATFPAKAKPLLNLYLGIPPDTFARDNGTILLEQNYPKEGKRLVGGGRQLLVSSGCQLAKDADEPDGKMKT
jgi:hypothetical protein